MIQRLGRPARLVMVSIWTEFDSFLIRHPIWTLSSDIQETGSEQIWSEVGIQPNRINSRPNVDIISGSLS
jgi:hypothetical protein